MDVRRPAPDGGLHGDGDAGHRSARAARRRIEADRSRHARARGTDRYAALIALALLAAGVSAGRARADVTGVLAATDAAWLAMPEADAQGPPLGAATLRT